MTALDFTASVLTVQPHLIEHNPNPRIFPHLWRAVTAVVVLERLLLEDVYEEVNSRDAKRQRIEASNENSVVGAVETKQDTSNSTDFICEECDVSFRSTGLLTDHINRKHVRRFKCTACGLDVAFNLRADLERHNRAKHWGGLIEGLKCTVEGCKTPSKTWVRKAWVRKDNPKRHMEGCRRSLEEVNNPK